MEELIGRMEKVATTISTPNLVDPDDERQKGWCDERVYEGASLAGSRVG